MPIIDITRPSATQSKALSEPPTTAKWLPALKQILPVYLATHIAFALLTLFAPLFSLADFGTTTLPLHTLSASWNRWDTGNYTTIATHGYAPHISLTAFFPLFPLLERAGTFFTHSPFVAGLLIANAADLIALFALYELVRKDHGEQCAARSVLYLSIFPSSFFLVAAYNESLFLCLALLCFCQLRHGRFWLAGIFGFLTCLTRSTGIFLLFPMAYVYLCGRQLRFDILALTLPLLGITAYSWYCSVIFGDPLAWEHAQVFWHHQFHFPWETLLITLKAIKHSPGLLSFQTLHNCLDLASILFALAMLVISIRRPPRLYLVYAVPLLLFVLSVPIVGNSSIPLQSMPRYALELFPVFIIAGLLGKHRWFHDSYLLLSGALLFVSCMLFLAGHWMV